MESEAKTVRTPEPRSDARTLTTGWTPAPRTQIEQALAEQNAARQHQARAELNVYVYGDPTLPAPAPVLKPTRQSTKRGKRGFLEPWQGKVHSAALKATDNRQFCKLLDIAIVPIPLNWKCSGCKNWTEAYDRGEHQPAIRRYKHRYRSSA